MPYHNAHVDSLGIIDPSLCAPWGHACGFLRYVANSTALTCDDVVARVDVREAPLDRPLFETIRATCRGVMTDAGTSPIRMTANRVRFLTLDDVADELATSRAQVYALVCAASCRPGNQGAGPG